ncbi:MAG: 4a-hydroxytetrahydrobiopterin dehydratase [Proteobacteria bacterium]|nr:4a-hydroxytetrahydrobiopterin dehydratase [Pseudomonadota bacterium]
MSALQQEECVPCQGGVPPLDTSEIAALLPEVPTWNLAADPARIIRRWRFPDFQTALDFVVRVGAVAESAGHHPDIAFGWGYVEVSLHTHAIKGLQRADFVLAAKIDALPKTGNTQDEDGRTA